MIQPARLLVVDDNPVVLLALSELMRKAGFEVFAGRKKAAPESNAAEPQGLNGKMEKLV